MSQGALALACGVQANTQHHYENGLRLPRADYLCALQTMGFDVQYILSGVRGTLGEAQLSEDEATVIHDFRLVQAGDQQAVLRILATLANGVLVIAEDPV
jgi:transcriptional regulator with XRE-family HTH domain